MLYRITVIDTDEHAPNHGSSRKYNEARHFGEFIVEAPAFRKYCNDYSEHGSYRMPDAVPEFAQDVATQYLHAATYDRTVLVEIEAVQPKRVGYGAGQNTGWTGIVPLSSFLLNQDYMNSHPGDSSRRFRLLASID